MTEPTPQIRLGTAAAIAGVLFFGAGPTFVAGATSSGLTIAVWRSIMAGAIPLLVSVRRGRFDRTTMRLTAVAGLSFGIANALFFTAVQVTSVANATLISVMQPVPLIIAGRLLFGERPRARDLVWVAFAVAGAVLMVVAASSAETGDIKGDLLALASLVFVAFYFVGAKQARRHLETLPFMAGMWIWTAAALLVILFVSTEPILPEVGLDWWRIAAIAALPGTGHILTNFSHEHLPLAAVGVLQLLTPVVAAVLALWFLDQSIAGWQWVGIATVVVTLTIYTVGHQTSVAATDHAAGTAGSE